jgi:hypothetical protein|tara:strand:- start:4562 stop:5410 length:849 start_codon:yes stop_codon:yes gene_type:complete
MKNIETLVEDIYQVIDDGFEPTIEAVEDLVEIVAHSVVRQFSPKYREDRNTLRMSNIGKPVCQLWHEANGSPKEKLDAHVRIKFLFGDIIEALIIYLAKEAGHKVTDEQKEVKVDGITGHMDCKIDGVTVDIKSASSFAFKKFNEGTLADDDPFGYFAQISGYATAEGEQEAGFVAMDKQLGKLTYMPVIEMDILDVPKRIKLLKEIVKQDTPPTRCFDAVPDGKSGNMKLPVNCSYCTFKETCWADANNGDGLRKFLYSNGPRWLTAIERIPDVKEVTNDG